MTDRSRRQEAPKSESSKERRKSFATMKDTQSSRSYPISNVAKKPIVVCSYSEMGCEFYTKKDNSEELIKHTRDKIEFHLQLANEAYKKIKSDNEETKRKYEKLKSEWNAYHMNLDQPQPRRRMSSESKMSLGPGPANRRISLSPVPYSSERRPSGGKISPSGQEARRKSTEILSNVLNTEFILSGNKEEPPIDGEENAK